MTMMLQIEPSAGIGMAIVAALGFLLVFAGIAFVAFKMLKRTVKMAVRMAIVAVILAVALIGSIYIFFSGSSNPPRQRPRTPAAR